MIEALVGYIESRGYTVRVQPSCIVINKVVGNLLLGLHWCIPRHDLVPYLKDALFAQADQHIARLKEAEGKQHAHLDR